jgi:XTP/dITP diphosphohydrolase
VTAAVGDEPASAPETAGSDQLDVLVLATRNAHKVAELRRILAEVGLDIELLDVVEAEARCGRPIPEVPETGATFEDNARLKAEAVAAASGLPAVADDSGLCVAALNGMPGVLSARWSGTGDDAANVDLVLAQMTDIAADRRAAEFVCAAALCVPGQETWVELGALAGSLVRAPRGRNGFGYDPIFVPDGETRTTAELTAPEKDAISHRGRAFRAMAARIAARGN